MHYFHSEIGYLHFKIHYLHFVGHYFRTGIHYWRLAKIRLEKLRKVKYVKVRSAFPSLFLIPSTSRNPPYLVNLIVAPAAVSGICANFVAESPSPHAIPRTADRA